MYRVLIADDEPIERQVISKKINDFFPDQVEIFIAQNGVEAVDKFKNNHCQIALLDIAMPGKNGLKAAEEIRDFDSHCSIIFLTAFDEFDYAKKAIGVKALDYLLKPGCDEDIIGVFEESFSLVDKRKKDPRIQENMASAKIDYSLEEEDLIFKKSAIVARETRQYIEEHYREDIALQDVADVLGYSDVYFCKLFKQHFGKSFIVYLNGFRIEKAKKYLANPNINIKDIGYISGYRDPNYFCRVFKRITGMTPTDYRNGALEK